VGSDKVMEIGINFVSGRFTLTSKPSNGPVMEDRIRNPVILVQTICQLGSLLVPLLNSSGICEITAGIIPALVPNNIFCAIFVSHLFIRYWCAQNLMRHCPIEYLHAYTVIAYF